MARHEYIACVEGCFGVYNHRRTQLYSKAAVDRADAELIIKQVGSQPLYLLDSVRFSTTTSFYLEQKLGRIIPFTSKVKSGDYIIVPGQPLDRRFDYYHKIYYHTDSFWLARKL